MAQIIFGLRSPWRDARRSGALPAFGVLLLWLLLAPVGMAQVAVPALRSPVTDLTQTLSNEQVKSLERTLREFEVRKGSQIAVLLVPTTQPETIEEYSIRVAETWQLGRRNADDGVLLLVAKDDRAVRIEVGYGLEGALPDVLANRITDQVMVPRFRAGDFAGGLREGVARIMAAIEGEPLPEMERTRSRGPAGESMLPLLLMLVFVGGGIARRLFGAVGGASTIAGVAGIVAWLLTSVVAVGIGAAVIAFLFTLLGGGGGSGWGGGAWTHRHRGWSGSLGGGGFGGWSGGGGGFGGGGASGRW